MLVVRQSSVETRPTTQSLGLLGCERGLLRGHIQENIVAKLRRLVRVEQWDRVQLNALLSGIELFRRAEIELPEEISEARRDDLGFALAYDVVSTFRLLSSMRQQVEGLGKVFGR